MPVPYPACSPAGDLSAMQMNPAPAWRKPELLRSQGLYIESVLKLFKAGLHSRTSKTLTGFVSLKKYCPVYWAMFWK